MIRFVLRAACVALACVTGCASSTTQSTTPEPRGGEAAPEDEVFECRMDGELTEERAREDSGGRPIETEPDTSPAPASPSAASDADFSVQSEQRQQTALDLADLYATQGAGLGALGCALDASDCASAAQLGDEICRLAERVCDVDEDDARCDEARSRCARARARIAASCGPAN